MRCSTSVQRTIRAVPGPESLASVAADQLTAETPEFGLDAPGIGSPERPEGLESIQIREISCWLPLLLVLRFTPKKCYIFMHMYTNNRQLYESLYGHLYTFYDNQFYEQFGDGRCVYCGEDAETIDHTYPISQLAKLANAIPTITRIQLAMKALSVR